LENVKYFNTYIIALIMRFNSSGADPQTAFMPVQDPVIDTSVIAVY
jgi:hypothetical protein